MLTVSSRHATRVLQTSGGFVELGHFHKLCIKNIKKAQQRKLVGVFVLDFLKTTFWMEDSTQRWTKLGLFFQKSGHFSRFSKKGREASFPFPLPTCAPVFLYFISSLILQIMKILKIQRPNAQNMEERMKKYLRKYFRLYYRFHNISFNWQLVTMIRLLWSIYLFHSHNLFCFLLQV